MTPKQILGLVATTGGLDHCGVYAYLQDYESPPGGGIYHDRKLIEGLWYYDEQYDVDYRRKVDALWQKRKKAY